MSATHKSPARPSIHASMWIIRGLGLVFILTAACFEAVRWFGPGEDAREPESVGERGTLFLWSVLEEGRGEGLLQDELLLLDSTPLFLPTEWNSSAHVRQLPQERPPTILFGEFPGLTASPTEVRNHLARRETGVVLWTPLQAIERFTADPWTVFARQDPNIPAVLSDSLRLEISCPRSGSVVVSRRIATDEWPGPFLTGTGSFAQFLLLVDVSAGMVQPLLLESSGSEPMDAQAARFLMTNQMVYWGLPPGYYLAALGR